MQPCGKECLQKSLCAPALATGLCFRRSQRRALLSSETLAPVCWRCKSFCVKTSALRYFHCTTLAARRLLFMTHTKSGNGVCDCVRGRRSLGSRSKWCSHLGCFINQLFVWKMALLPLSLFSRAAVATWPEPRWGVGAQVGAVAIGGVWSGLSLSVCPPKAGGVPWGAAAEWVASQSSWAGRCGGSAGWGALSHWAFLTPVSLQCCSRMILAVIAGWSSSRTHFERQCVLLPFVLIWAQPKWPEWEQSMGLSFWVTCGAQTRTFSHSIFLTYLLEVLTDSAGWRRAQHSVCLCLSAQCSVSCLFAGAASVSSCHPST